MSAIKELIDAIEGIQDWGGTHVGDCIAAVEAEQFTDITDLRTRLADAQARAERAEGERDGLRQRIENFIVQLKAGERHCNDARDSIGIATGSALKTIAQQLGLIVEDASTPAPQGRTDGELLNWLSAYSRVVKADSSRTVVQIQLPVAKSFRAAINLAMDATAPEVKGGAA